MWRVGKGRGIRRPARELRGRADVEVEVHPGLQLSCDEHAGVRVVVVGDPGGDTLDPLETTGGNHLEAAQGGLLLGCVSERAIPNTVLYATDSLAQSGGAA